MSSPNLNSCGAVFDLAGKEKRLSELEALVAKEGFWNKPDEAKAALKERTAIGNRLERFKQLTRELEENQGLLEMAVAENDEGTLADLGRQAEDL